MTLCEDSIVAAAQISDDLGIVWAHRADQVQTTGIARRNALGGPFPPKSSPTKEHGREVG